MKQFIYTMLMILGGWRAKFNLWMAKQRANAMHYQTGRRYYVFREGYNYTVVSSKVLSKVNRKLKTKVHIDKVLANAVYFTR